MNPKLITNRSMRPMAVETLEASDLHLGPVTRCPGIRKAAQKQVKELKTLDHTQRWMGATGLIRRMPFGRIGVVEQIEFRALRQLYSFAGRFA